MRCDGMPCLGHDPAPARPSRVLPGPADGPIELLLRPPGDTAPYDNVRSTSAGRLARLVCARLRRLLRLPGSANAASQPLCAHPHPSHHHAPPPSFLRPLLKQATPDLVIEDPALGQALWTVYLNPTNTNPAPEARKAWLAGLQALGK